MAFVYVNNMTMSDILLVVLLIFFGLVIGLSSLRRRILTQWIYQFLKKKLPAISQTEREAIEAGDTWWEAEIFQGKPHWRKFLQYPKPVLTDQERSFIHHQVNHLCGLLNQWEINFKQKDLPQEVWDYLKKERFFSMIIPKKYGGLEFSPYANSIVIQKISLHSITAAITVMVPNSLGPGELLLKYGTEKQKNYYLPRLANGEEIPCFGLTELEAGSDATGIQSKGFVSYGTFEGKKTIGITLSWNKRYITLAPVATVLGLAFKLFDPDKLLGGEISLGITLCLVPTNHAGVNIGKRHYPLYDAFMNGPTEGRDVFVPLEWVIGGQEMIGKGWRMLVECLSQGRGISLPALALSAGKLCYRSTGAYAAIRKQFRLPIHQFEGVETVMAQIAGNLYLQQASNELTLSSLNKGHKPSVITAIAKYHMTELARKSIHHTMDVHGGRAIMLGPKNYLSNVYCTTPIMITVEGANILTRNLMIYGQGAIRCHRYLKNSLLALSDSNQKNGIKALDQVIYKHARDALFRMFKLFFHVLTGYRLIFSPVKDETRKYYKSIERMSLSLSVLSEFVFLFMGGQLKRFEKLSARLGDVLSHLYMATAALKYFKEGGSDKEELHMVDWSCQYCMYTAQTALVDFFENYPNQILSWILKQLIFPFGLPYKKPKDRLEKKLVKNMTTNNKLRDRLTEHCFEGTLPQNLKILEENLKNVNDVSLLQKRLKQKLKKEPAELYSSYEEQIHHAKTKGLIDEAEATVLLEAHQRYLKLLEVDAFDAKQMQTGTHL